MSETVSDHSTTEDGQSAIYCILHIETGKCYIGSSINYKDRFYNHTHCLNRGIHKNAKLQAAWSKYGEDAFAFEVLEEVPDPACLIAQEQVWLDAVSACELGYNLAPIAQNSLGIKRSEDTRRRIADAARHCMADPRIKELHRRAIKDAMSCPELKLQLSRSAKEKWQRSEFREAAFKTRNTPEYRKMISQAVKIGIERQKKEMGEEAYQTMRIRVKLAQLKAVSKTYMVTAPDGNTVQVTNLKGFCAERGLSYGYMNKVANGHYPSGRGYRIKLVEAKI